MTKVDKFAAGFNGKPVRWELTTYDTYQTDFHTGGEARQIVGYVLHDNATTEW